MVAIPLPVTSMPGRNPQESSGRLINCYAEPLGKGARWPAVRRRVAGLSGFGTSPETGFRGMIDAGGFLYAVIGTKAFRFPSTGGAGVSLGNLPGEAKCFFAKNNAVPVPDIVVVSPGDGAFVLTPTSVEEYPDTDVGQPDSVCFHNGYFFFTSGRGQIIASGLNTTAINALDFTSADAKPDGIVAIVPWQESVFVCGVDSIEVWSGISVNPTGFPYNRGAIIQPGLAGGYAIAGHDDGFGQALIYVGSDSAVYILNGYAPQKISPPDLDALIEAVSDKSTLEASVHSARGHAFWTISGPNFTWEYDLRNQTWHERQSYLINRWRGTQTRKAFGKWLCGDTKTGNILQIDPNAKNEVRDALRVRIESEVVAKFPDRIPIARIDVDLTLGVGIATGSEPNQTDVDLTLRLGIATGSEPNHTDPSLEISVTRDGLNFTNPRFVKIGRQASVHGRVFATRFGTSRASGMRVRFDISDEVDVAIMGATMTPGA